MNSLDESINDPEVIKIKKFIENLNKDDLSSLGDIENKLNADPNNKDLRFEYSKNFCNQMKLKKDLMRFSFFIMMILNGMRKQLKKNF